MFVSFTGRYLRLSVHELPKNDKLIVYDPAKESTFKKMEKQNCTNNDGALNLSYLFGA